MANLKLLQEAIEAFANGEQDVADKKMRKYFVEQAQEINKELEESMDDEECCDEDDKEEKLEEDFDVSPDAGLNSQIEYSLGEEDKSAEDDIEFQAGEEDSEGEVGAEGEEVPSEDQWASIQDAFRGLQQMFDEISGEGEVDLDAEEPVGGEEEVDLEVGSEDGGDDFADVQFGDEKVGESFKLKAVADVDKKEKAGANTKSPVASQAKSPVQGVAPVKIAKNSTPVVDDKFDGVDTESHTVPEDMNNVMDSGKGVMKDVKKVTTGSSKSRSPLPKSQPKF
ncbi:hypothetical protein FOI42_RS01850 [Escherichia coli]|nr:hypothetical protein [Escherichia coli]MED6699557.1 hypothetical protein [Escherichia coli O157]USL83674.1 structural protein [Escherichia phage A4]HCQ0858438.1 hypothetical protein [Escherichia coli]